MASIVSDPGGKKRLLYVDASGKRRTLRLGKADLKTARAVATHIERLVNAAAMRQPVAAETAQWIAALDDKFHRKLSAVGLIAPRAGDTLGGWLDDLLAEKAATIKPASLLKLQQTATRLRDAWGSQTPLRAITAAQAASWRAGLVASGLSMAAVKVHIGNAKSIMGDAERRGMIHRNPLAALRGGSTPAKATRFITRHDIEAVIEAAPSL